jgi:metal-dependent amidase/aminoacylase/carboxypeptidase family protein
VRLEEFLSVNAQRLVEVRRDLHAHPELGGEERRTTSLVGDALAHAGLTPRVLPSGTGLICDIGAEPVVALRADLDALPIPDENDGRTAPWSTVSLMPAVTTCTRPSFSVPGSRWPGWRPLESCRTGCG